MKCFHGVYDASVCAVCKDWPSFEKMRQRFPELPESIFLVMTVEERKTALATGRLPR